MSESAGRLPASLVALAVGIGTAAEGTAMNLPPQWVFVGTYTGPESRGIYRLTFDPTTGKLSEPTLAAETPNPSFLAIAPDGRHLYAVNEVGQFEGSATGSVSGFDLDPADGSLRLLNVEPSGGTDPCHLVVAPDGHYVLVANYSGGSVSVLPITTGGRLGPPASTIQHEGHGPDLGRQKGPHAHSVQIDPAGRHALSADLGTDQLLICRYDPATGRLDPLDPPSAEVDPGQGPRHFAFNPGGDRVYLIDELDNTINVYRYDSGAGTFARLQTVGTLPDGFEGGNTTAEVVVHPTGRFVYGSNRGADSLAIFEVVEADGTLRPVGHVKSGGKTPRNFQIDPTGQFLIAANQDSDNLVVFRIDPETGGLTPVGDPVKVPSPVCVKFVPIEGPK